MSACLNESTVRMSGFAAPALTVAPIPERARSRREPAAIVPRCVSASIAVSVRITTSAASPTVMRGISTLVAA